MTQLTTAEPLDPPSVESDLAAALSFDAVYEQHFEFIWRNLRHLGMPEAHLDDAVQEVFLIVYRRLGEFEGRAHITTWLFSIVRNVARYHRRTLSQRASRFQTIGPTELETVAGSSRGPDATMEAQQAAELLLELLEGLAEKKREVFVLVELEKLSVAQAAQMLGLNVHTAASRLRSARSYIKQAMTRLKAQEKWQES